jgi:glutamate formiminotransferase
MALLAIPNVSEGRDRLMVEHLGACISAQGAHILDIHADARHNRAVYTTTGEPHDLVAGMVALAVQAKDSLDLTTQRGVHPRVGVLDVCPFVPHESSVDEAVATARSAASSIAIEAGFPVYLYGAAAEREATRELPDLRRGGLSGLMRRAAEGLEPDFGSDVIDDRYGVVCVGARDVLIAFNVWLRTGDEIAKQIAAEVRTAGGGLPGVRALGVPIEEGISQVTMNLIDPGVTGIDRAFEAVVAGAAARGVEVTGTEIVGLVPERFLPDPDAEAARLLKEPGRSVESALGGLLAPPG